ncbi:MAG: TonB-dependent receptor [Chitinophagales bacterium]
MKKVLFFLLLGHMAFGQTDTTAKTTSVQEGVNLLKAADLNEISISATRAGSNTPTVSQTLKKEELNKNNLGQDVPFLLDNTPSVVVTSDAGAGVGYTGIRIRGSDNTRVNVTLNGIPVNDGESQGVYWVDLPDVVSSAQSVQIQRGVGSSTNGPGAFGGTISMQTQTPSQKAFGEAAVSGGSFNTLKLTGKAGTGMHKGYFAEGSASYITSDGYIDRASSKLNSWFAQAGVLSGPTLIKVLYFGGREKTYQAWNGVPQDSLKTNRTFNDLGTDYGQHFPPYKNQTDNYSQDYVQVLFAQQLPRSLYLNIAGFATYGRGYYEEYKAGTDFLNYFPSYDTASVYTDLARQKWLRNIFYGGTFSLNYANHGFDVTLGGLLGQFNGQHFGKVVWAQEIKNLDKDAHYYDGRVIKNDFNVYLKFNYELKQKANFYADVQYRYVNHNTHGIDDDLSAYSINKTWHFINPKAGVLYKIKPEHHVYASIAVGNREPNRDDLMAATAAKPVKPETLYDVEAGYKFFNNRFPLAVNFYYMYYKDQLVLTGRLNDVGNPIKENVGQSYRAGIELNGSFNFYKAGRPTAVDVLETGFDYTYPYQNRVFAINYAFAYSINKINSLNEYIYTYDENYLPIDSLTLITTHKNSNISFSPSIVASLELVAYPVKGLSISLMNKAVSKQYLDNTGNEGRKIPAFFYSNINISYSLPLNKPGKEITLKLLLNNIFNRLYVSNGYTYSERYTYPNGSGGNVLDGPYTYNYYYPQAGFNMLGGINVRF